MVGGGVNWEIREHVGGGGELGAGGRGGKLGDRSECMGGGG